MEGLCHASVIMGIVHQIAVSQNVEMIATEEESAMKLREYVHALIPGVEDVILLPIALLLFWRVLHLIILIVGCALYLLFRF